jgi:hypothetical protein
MGLKRRVGRSLIIVLFAGASMMVLALTSMISVPVSRADNPDEPLNALMMGGLGWPTPSAAWMDAIITDYIDPATGGHYTPLPVLTPESFASTSISTGLANLQAAMTHQQAVDPGQPYVVEGYSESAIIATDEKIQLMEAGQPATDATFLLLGSPNVPDGGVFERFAGLVIPGLVGFNFNGAEPTDVGIPTVDIVNQYDLLADYPQFPLDSVADLNALFGFVYAHGGYGDGYVPGFTLLWPPSAPLAGPFADQYFLGSSEVVKQVDGDTTFYFIPTTELPLLDPLRSLGVPESILNIVQPALQVIVEEGYDRSIPFGDPTPAQLIPTTDPITFSLEFAKAVVQGANNAFGLFGAQLPGATELENQLDEAQSWSTQEIGVPYDQAVSAINDAFNPFTASTELEAPLGQAIQSLLDLTGIQQDVLDPVLGLFGSFGSFLASFAG